MNTPIRVLIVEDHPMVAEGTKEGLSSFGHTVVGIAATGQQAIELAETQSPDLILMDVRIAGPMDGVEAARIIHQREPVPIVFLTAFSDEKLLDRARCVGASGYLVKPYNLTELHATVEITYYKAKADRALQEMKARAQQAEKAESLARMAGAVAHNYNNIVQAVIGNLELAEEMIPPDQPYSQFVKNAHKSAVAAATLGKRMLDYIGQTYLAPGTVDLAHLCTTYFQTRILPETISLHIIEQPLAVIGDEKQLMHILDILINNAMESIDTPPGKIEVIAGVGQGSDIVKRAHDALTPEPDAASYGYIEVKDTGCGIDKNALGKIFDPFFTTKFSGRGLGLSVATGLTKAGKGYITVESQPGQGSSFCVWFPLIPATP
jgi:signal transduction histidine kinase